MNTAFLRVCVIASLLAVAGGCGRHAVRTSPVLDVAPSPPHEPRSDDARQRADAKLDALARRLRQSAHPAEHQAEQPAPLLGVVGGQTPQATIGSVVVTTTAPTNPSGTLSETESAPSTPVAPNGRHRDVVFPVVIAGVLIGVIKLVPRWTDRA